LTLVFAWDVQVMKISSKTTNIALFFLMQLLFFFFYFPASGEDKSQNHPVLADRDCVKYLIIGEDTLIDLGKTSPFFKRKVFSFRNNFLIIELFPKASDSGNVYIFNLQGVSSTVNQPVAYQYKEYTNLSPGNYLIEVNVIHQGVPKACLKFPFRILPPFYRTPVAYVYYLIGIILVLWAVYRMRNYNFAKQRFLLEQIINERTEELLREKDRTEKLLTNVLPKNTVDEIKSTGRAKKKKFQMVTVLFSDIQGFTKIAESMNSEILIDELDRFFFHFDSVVEKYNIEKIKTIGDAYMCAGGIPEKNRTNPVEVVLAAMEMQHYMSQLKKELQEKNRPVWDIRIGIHTGSVIAGVIGHKKLSYDIWGDTVNTASRMESSGEAGKINISGSTYELVKDFFICEYRGKMPVKYKGEIDMYFVEGIRPELVGRDKITPNHDFFIRLQMLRLQDLEEYILEKLESELSMNLYFHNVKHSIHVYTMVELLGRAEGVATEEMLLLRTAALMHDTGYIMTYENHEKASCDLAMDILPKYKYSEDQIEKICDLIEAGKDPFHPKTKLEAIMFDANYNYLSRIDFRDVAWRIWNEVKAYNKEVPFETWKKEMIDLISQYDYHTTTARKLRDIDKKTQICIIRNLSET